VIVEYDGAAIGRINDLSRAVAATPAGRAVPLGLVRDGRRTSVTLVVAALDEPRPPTPTDAAGDGGPLGLAVEAVTPGSARDLGLARQRGVLVIGVRDASPAADAGLRPGDVIIAVDRQDVGDVPAVRRALASHPAGTPILVQLLRGGDTVYLAVAA
jgi:S1-C subfamily serine protease